MRHQNDNSNLSIHNATRRFSALRTLYSAIGEKGFTPLAKKSSGFSSSLRSSSKDMRGVAIEQFAAEAFAEYGEPPHALLSFLGIELLPKAERNTVEQEQQALRTVEEQEAHIKEREKAAGAAALQVSAHEAGGQMEYIKAGELQKQHEAAVAEVEAARRQLTRIQGQARDAKPKCRAHMQSPYAQFMSRESHAEPIYLVNLPPHTCWLHTCTQQLILHHSRRARRRHLLKRRTSIVCGASQPQPESTGDSWRKRLAATRPTTSIGSYCRRRMRSAGCASPHLAGPTATGSRLSCTSSSSGSPKRRC